MSFPRYGAYRVTGAEWLGDIPAHWETTRIKNLFEITKNIAGSDDHDVLSITQNGIKRKDVESNEGQISNDYSKYQLVYRNYFAMNGMDLLTGYVDISPFDGIISPDYRVFFLRDQTRGFDKYLLYLLQMGYKQKIFYAFGQGASQLGRWRFPTDEFNSFVLPLPPIEEQIGIAAFLDNETAKIDSLITEQERLVALLKEKRRAVISHAVTKGLDPNALTKDAGVEWLGDVPTHWKVSRIGRYLDIISGFAFPSERFTLNAEDTRLLRGINVGVQEIRWEETVYWAREDNDGLDRFMLSPGDVVIGMDRPWIGSGTRVAVIGEEDVPCLLLQRVASLIPDQSLQRPFLYLLLQSREFVDHFTPDMTGVSVPHISPDQIREFVVALPPRDEQTRIVEWADNQFLRLDALVAESKKAIALLQERRSALISAAVTGRIDVRSPISAEAEAA